MGGCRPAFGRRAVHQCMRNQGRVAIAATAWYHHRVGNCDGWSCRRRSVACRGARTDEGMDRRRWRKQREQSHDAGRSSDGCVKSGDTFQQHNETDQRTISLNNTVLQTAYTAAQNSRGRFYDAINALTTASPDKKSEIAEMYWGVGLVEMSLSEVFCNGVPFGSVVNGSPVYTDPLTNQQGFALSITHFDSALALVNGATDSYSIGVRNATLVAKARALVDMGKFAEAAALVPASVVPTNYQYVITYSQPTQDNEIWTYNGQGQSVARMVVGDSVDLLNGQKNIIANAIPFASANDPR